MANQTPNLPPGFRFHPTDEELIVYYLKNRAESSPCPVPIIAEVNIYKFDPWALPGDFGDKEWYFFSPRDQKYPNGVRPNRAAGSGYWKATRTDKPIPSNGNKSIGVKKTLVFYKGKPPKGIKTNWIMHESRLSESKNKSSMRPLKLRDSSMRLDDWVLCRIYRKNSHQQEESTITETESSSQGNNFEMHKSFSLSELLNEADFSLLSSILEAPIETEMPLSEKNSFVYSNLNQTIIDRNTYLETEPSIFINENSLKRQRIEEGDGHSFYPSKKENNNSWVYTNFGDQFDSDALYQEMFLNSQFGMQRIEEGDGHSFYPSKKENNNSWVYTNFGDQFDSDDLYQEMFLNSQFGMQ